MLSDSVIWFNRSKVTGSGLSAYSGRIKEKESDVLVRYRECVLCKHFFHWHRSDLRSRLHWFARFPSHKRRCWLAKHSEKLSVSQALDSIRPSCVPMLYLLWSERVWEERRKESEEEEEVEILSNDRHSSLKVKVTHRDHYFIILICSYKY